MPRYNRAPLGGPIERGLRNHAERPQYDGSRRPTYSGGDPFKTYDFDHEVNTIGNSTRDFERGLADVVGGVSDLFFPPGFEPESPYQADAGAYGMPGYDAWQKMLGAGGAAAGGRNVLNMDQANQARGVQTGLIQQLQAQARGDGPSIAQEQLKQATDQNMAQAAAQAASGRGAGAGGAAYQVGNQRAAAGQKMAGDSAVLRLQEQMQAQNMLAGVSGQMRGQDLSSQGLNLQQTSMNDDLVKFYTQAGLSLEQAQQQSKQALEEMRVKQQIEFEKIKAGAAAGNQGGGSGLGGMLSMFGMG
jgi:hypothetical protein